MQNLRKVIDSFDVISLAFQASPRNHLVIVGYRFIDDENNDDKYPIWNWFHEEEKRYSLLFFLSHVHDVIRSEIRAK